MSPFDEVHTALVNEPHTEINARNKRWFMRAVLEDIDSDKDGLDDYEEYLIGTDYANADSDLRVETAISPISSAEISMAEADGAEENGAGSGVSGTLALSYSPLPNVEYNIWFTEALDQPWQPLDTVPPTNISTMTRLYNITNSTGFFSTTGHIADPVTD